MQIRNIVEGADMPPSRGGGFGAADEEDEEGEEDRFEMARQTMMFSATFPRGVRAIADSFLEEPVMLQVGRVGGAASTVTQKLEWVEGTDFDRTSHHTAAHRCCCCSSASADAC